MREQRGAPSGRRARLAELERHRVHRVEGQFVAPESAWRENPPAQPGIDDLFDRLARDRPLGFGQRGPLANPRREGSRPFHQQRVQRGVGGCIDRSDYHGNPSPFPAV